MLAFRHALLSSPSPGECIGKFEVLTRKLVDALAAPIPAGPLRGTPTVTYFSEEGRLIKKQMRIIFCRTKQQGLNNLPAEYFLLKRHLSCVLREGLYKQTNEKWKHLIQAARSNDTRGFWPLLLGNEFLYYYHLYY
uniref:Uncharacterized protein n=1 Tax=Sphaerodactylus townsendi TaxID=933632 RepID=A0ACB8FA11_9SAUR